MAKSNKAGQVKVTVNGEKAVAGTVEKNDATGWVARCAYDDDETFVGGKRSEAAALLEDHFRIAHTSGG